MVIEGSYFAFSKSIEMSFKRFGLPITFITKNFIITLLAAALSALLTNPLSVLQNRMTKRSSDIQISNSMMLYQIYKEEGIKGLYKGILPSLVLTLNPVIKYSLYNLMKNQLVDQNGILSAKHIVFISAVSKLVTTVLTYPMMTLKTMFMSNDNKDVEAFYKKVVTKLQSEGTKMLFKGMNIKLIHAMLNNIVLMTVYERINVLIKAVLVILIKGQRL